MTHGLLDDSIAAELDTPVVVVDLDGSTHGSRRWPPICASAGSRSVRTPTRSGHGYASVNLVDEYVVASDGRIVDRWPVDARPERLTSRPVGRPGHA